MHSKATFAAVVVGCLLTVTPVNAQDVNELAGRVHATRADLESQLRSLQDMAVAETASESQRTWARAQFAATRTRLAEGDFHVGDRIAIAVAGDAQAREGGEGTGRTLEQQLSDTFTVNLAQELTLPVVGVVSLRGVLRSDLEAHLSREVARVIRDPVLQARPLIRLSMQGAVANPGYYTLAADAVLSDALMVAGGPAAGAKIKKMRIERDGKPVWRGDSLQRAIAEGRTLLELGLRAGDQVVVPEGASRTEGWIRTIAAAVSIPIAIYSLMRD